MSHSGEGSSHSEIHVLHAFQLVFVPNASLAGDAMETQPDVVQLPCNAQAQLLLLPN